VGMRFRGFTLVELVVVMAVIAMLAGLTTPILRDSRERARTVVCAGKLKQLLGGLLSYETENDAFPYGFQSYSGTMESPDHYAGIAGTMDLPGRWWFDCLGGIDHTTGTGEKLLTCPSKRQVGLQFSLNVLCGNYGANLSLCRVRQYTQPYQDGFFGDRPAPRTTLRPAETLLLVDSGYSLISWWHATNDPPVSLPRPSLMVGGIQHGAYVPGMKINADRILLPGQADDAMDGRHPNRTVNVGFADGAVACKKADELLVEKSGDRWNSNPLWQPGGDAVTP